MLVTQSTKCVIFHFGTNNIPKYHYSDPKYWFERNSLDGAIQVNSMYDIMSDFMGNILKFDENTWSLSGIPDELGHEHQFTLCISDILPRHQDVMHKRMRNHNSQPGKSTAQKMVGEVNKELRDTRMCFPDIQILSHSNLENPRLYQVSDYCRHCEGMCGKSSLQIDYHYFLPLTDKGKAKLRSNFECYLQYKGISQ